MIRPATSTPVAVSTPSSPGEQLTSMTTGPWFERRMSTPDTLRPERPGGPHGDAALLGREPHLLGGPAAVQVRAEVAGRALALDGGDHPVADDEARMSLPPASLMYSCTRMLASSWRKAAITDSAAFLVSASTTPTPWVPSSSFTITGAPPTVSSSPSMSLVEWAKPVTGRPMPVPGQQLQARSLSRVRVIAWHSLAESVPISSNWRTTAVP